MRRPLTLILAALWATVACGCATSEPRPEPQTAAVDEARAEVDEATEEGSEEADDRDTYAVTARHNPCKCEAPPIEVHVYGRWERVILEGDDDRVDDVEQELRSASEEGQLAGESVEGAFDGTRRDERRLEYRVFELDE